MNISIFGLGYVGCVGIGCLASQGHCMIGVDVSEEKVRLIQEGKPTIVEKGIVDLMHEGWRKGLVHATTNYREAVMNSDISFLCVGTPSAANGHLNLSYIYQAAEEIGRALATKNEFHIVVIRSTVFPGTNDRVCSIIEEQSGKKRDVDFAVASNPEFLREGTAVHDYLNPPITVIGCNCSQAIAVLQELYAPMGAPIEIVPVGVAEMIKYVNNSYHALKVVFANEVGSICKEVGVDAHEVMRIFCMDKQLNISPYYFKSGFAYGGSCLPKDLKGLKTLAHDLGQNTPVLNAIEESNVSLIRAVTEKIEKLGKKKIGFLGFSFKAGTDDMRNSPIVEVAASLVNGGCDIRIFDKNVSQSYLLGSNTQALSEKIPTFVSALQDDLQNVKEWADVLVISNKDAAYEEMCWRDDQMVFDLARIPSIEGKHGYIGLWW